MTKNYRNIPFTICLVFLLLVAGSSLVGQENSNILNGKVLESGSGNPIENAIISLSSTGNFQNSDADGNFTITLPSAIERINILYPGYHKSTYIVDNENEITIYLTKLGYASNDDLYTLPLSDGTLKNATGAISVLQSNEFDKTGSVTFDAALQNKIAGMRTIEHSGMPGHSAWMNIRGISSIYGTSEPLVVVDGMIHETRYPSISLISGHMLNPTEIVDLDDIVNITVSKTGEAHLGAAGSNGMVYVNTEKNKETSSEIKFKVATGFTLKPASLDVMDAGQYKNYFTQVNLENGMSMAQVNSTYPWLNGGTGASEYYRYNNNTDWQDYNYEASAYQKYHFYLKGGDDIATYNISTGYLQQGGPFDNWKYTRYNLRLNGKINITNKFAVIPNSKLSLSDSYLSNMGPDGSTNPVLANLLNPPILGPYARTETGSELALFDDVSVLGTSNPSALLANSLGSGRNVALTTSVKGIYKINQNLSVSNLIGLSVNNDRENIFIPDIGVIDLYEIKNSPRDMVTEHRSVQNFTTISYKNTSNHTRQIEAFAGVKYMMNTYKNNYAIDYNTPTDDFRSLGRGSGFEYLRISDGEINGLKWLSYFGKLNYNYLDKFYVSTALSLDGISRLNANNRFNFYPGVYTAWRPIENLSTSSTKINDLKLRASFDITGNMFSDIYYLSELFYTGRRYTNIGVVVRDFNPNEELTLEKKSTINIGADILTNKKSLKLEADVFYSMVNNLIINQQLPYSAGFPNYYNNGGKLINTGAELALNYRKHFSTFTFVLDATATSHINRITGLEFIDADSDFSTVEIAGVEYIISEKNAINSYYGYKTKGIYATNAQANGILGPNQRLMGAGDVIFEDTNADNIIDDKDKQILGNPNPLVFGAISTMFQYKNMQFYALFNYSYGNDIYNYVRYQMTAMDDFSNQSPDVLKRWTSTNTNADLPKASFGDPNGNNVFSDRWIEDGSYLKVKEIRLSYNVGSYKQIAKEIDIFASATNLFTLTKYTGYDPETMHLNNPFLLGLDFGKIPQLRTFILGVKISL